MNAVCFMQKLPEMQISWTNYRVKLEDSIETMLGKGITEETLGGFDISDEVFEDTKKRMSVLSSKRRTPMDFWVSYFAMTFDIYFSDTLQIIEAQDYIRRMAGRVSYTNEKTRRRMDALIENILSYMQERIDQHD